MLEITQLIRCAKEFTPVVELGRISWPFSTMEAGGSLLIPTAFAKRAQRAAGTYAAHSGFKLITRTLPTGDLLVVKKS